MTSTARGGRREGAGRKPLEDGLVRHLIGLTPRHINLLDQYQDRHRLASRSAAMRHMIESRWCRTSRP
jgi:hypothetical protein